MTIGRIKNYPWHQELVSLVCLLTILASAWQHYDLLPEPMAMHFDLSGTPDGYGSRFFNLSLLLGLVAFQWVIDFAIRYQFLLAESSRKRFNWIQLLSTPGVVTVAWVWHALVNYNLHHIGERFEFGWGSLLSWVALSTIYLFLTEKLRPQAVSDGKPISGFGEELSRQLPDRFCLVDHVNPTWWMHLMLWPGILLLLSGIAMLFGPGWVVKGSGLICILSAPLCLLFAGGFRFVLNHKGLEIQFGTLSIPLKSIPKEEIESYEIKEYNALADFGGWGLRWGKDKTTAYIISGDLGLLVKTAKRNYLLGSGQSRAFYSALEQLMNRD